MDVCEPLGEDVPLTLPVADEEPLRLADAEALPLGLPLGVADADGVTDAVVVVGVSLGDAVTEVVWDTVDGVGDTAANVAHVARRGRSSRNAIAAAGSGPAPACEWNLVRTGASF